MPTPSDIEARFTHHPPRDEADVAAHNAVRSRIKEAATFANEVLPEGREKATTLTKLEEAMFWANAALARARA